jgi:hypothetical protein
MFDKTARGMVLVYVLICENFLTRYSSAAIFRSATAYLFHPFALAVTTQFLRIKSKLTGLMNEENGNVMNTLLIFSIFSCINNSSE